MTTIGRDAKLEVITVECNDCGKSLEFMVYKLRPVQGIDSITVSVKACEDCIDAAVGEALYYQDKSNQS